MRVLDRLQDTPAQVVTSLGETLVQTPPAVALLGDETAYAGPDRSMVYRWFTRLWSEHEIAVPRGHQKRIRTAELGVLEVYCQMLYDLDQDQALLIFTATPGSDSSDKLQLLSVIGAQKLRSPS
jgi:MmyB-like transcription regulator ligand binding domain